MSQLDKLIAKFKARPIKNNIRFEEAKKLLMNIGFEPKYKGSSHVVFRCDSYPRNISIKKDTNVGTYSLRISVMQ